MDTFNLLLQGFGTALSLTNLLWALFGCALGTAVGVLPGIGPATTVAMLLPITAKVDITASMIFFAGIYYGAMYGGSTTSILLNTPGETASRQKRRELLDLYLSRRLTPQLNLRLDAQNLLRADTRRLSTYAAGSDDWRLASNERGQRTLLLSLEGKW